MPETFRIHVNGTESWALKESVRFGHRERIFQRNRKAPS
jgi:hypothetical protein